MMDKLLFVPDIMARYHCSAPTARKRMRQMLHMEKPLAVWESTLAAWEREKMKLPVEKGKAKKRAAAVQWDRIPRNEKGEFHIPRRRA